jgi:hypothetical protein
MERKAAELRNLGVDEYFTILDPGRWRYAISLGVFRSEEGATRFLAQLRQMGVRSATVGEREQRVTQTAFLISEPTVRGLRIAYCRMPLTFKLLKHGGYPPHPIPLPQRAERVITAKRPRSQTLGTPSPALLERAGGEVGWFSWF